MHDDGSRRGRSRGFAVKFSPVATLLLLLGSHTDALAADAGWSPPITTSIDALWVILATVLVVLMQIGFLGLEIGFVRPKNAVATAFKNLGDWLIVSLAFVFIGFGLMFGTTNMGLFGWTLFPNGFPDVTLDPWLVVFVLFQLSFAGTAATIVSGAMAERTGFRVYLMISVILGALLYPIFGHWVWGGAYFGASEAGWLANLGFVDFAGSSVVHGTGAWAALAGILVVGPRLGRYDDRGNRRELGTNTVHWAVLGTFLLWIGWFGFNGGSALAFNSDALQIIFVTNTAAAAAGVMGFLHATLAQERRDLAAKTLGSALGGLVAITACAHVVSIWSALLIGGCAALVHNLSYELVLDRWKLDDVVGAIPVHGFCGVWGLLSVALFGVDLPHPRAQQLGVQFLGVAVNFAWAFGGAFAMFKVMGVFGSLRVPGRAELEGLTLAELVGSRRDELDDSAKQLFDELSTNTDSSSGIG